MAMVVDVRILTAIIIVCSSPSFAQQGRCSYMTAIPREQKPDNLLPIESEGLPWNERPLISAWERDDVCMDAYVPIGTADGVQVIYMDEEREGEVAIARLNYNGASEPSVDPNFDSGTFNNLGPVLRNDDGAWYLYTTVRQNYEAGMTQYAFTIRIPGETLAVMVNLQIVNIDDNQPMMEIFEACQVPELGEPRLTECVYVVTDADGEISTSQMQFRIDSDRGDDEIFYIEGSLLPNTWFTMHMTVGIRTALDFEESPLHIFSVTAMDSLPNNHTVTMMVQVENVEHRPPRWVQIFAVQQFDEKTEQKFTVRAIDGDTGLNNSIHYRIETDPRDTFFRIETIEGGHSGAIFYVDKIDRDALEREVFQLDIIAYKAHNESSATATPVVIIVNDVNDCKPEPLHTEYHIEIEEETAMTLDLEEFGFHDRDLGENAQYTVHLEAVSPPGAEAAFYIAPQVGYQRQEFIMGTANHSMLDFEVPEFQHIVMRVVATDITNKPDFVGVAMLYINLTNWNDELPIFEYATKTVSFNETEGEGFYVGTMLANDRDIDDIVEHSLMSNVGDFLRIDQDTGEIYVSANDSFDYHRQNVIFVQVRADDTLGAPYNTATSQLVIELLDINNTPPTLRLPRGSPQVEENRPAGFSITDDNSAITATDPDTTAHLVFEIDWETSYATKQGRETDPLEYHNCVDIVTSYPDEEHLGAALGHLIVREIRDNVTIDFEMFEVMYLTIRVRDLNTYIGDEYDESTLAITIIDLNDNPPVWDEGTLEQNFTVREMANQGVVIGSILATDIDGPLYNQVRYSIFPRDDTPEDLVQINFFSGQITVNTSQAIDADIPPRYYLNYTVLASDRCTAEDPADCPPDPHYHDTFGEIEIFITDINNKVPEPDYERFDTTVYIYENATTGDDVTYVVASDKDRDEIYNTVRYQINYAVNTRLLDFFMVDLDSGRVVVNYTTTTVLDRDGDEPQHRIFFTLIDNLYGEGDGNRNQNDTEILVVLLDVNDNAPELPDPSALSWSISEDLRADMSIVPVIHAPDRDEPNTPNSLVGFDILGLTPTTRDIEVPDLFLIRSIDTDRGELVTAMDLRGYWGTYYIHIHAFDHGHPQQHSFEDYTLVVRPYNYHAPEFVFPTDGALIRFARERAVQNSFLVTLDQEFLRLMEATDEDGLEAGQATFSVSGNDEAIEFFEISSNAAEENQAALILRQTITDNIREFQITIRATDGGTEPGPLWTETTFRAVFVPTTGDPVFETNTASVAFIEKEAGMDELCELPLAVDQKNYLCTDDCHNIYYRIIDGNTEGHFILDPSTNVLTLATELDRSVSAQHTLVVAAGNSPTGSIPLSSSMLTVTVTVREADPRPIFVSKLYTAGISTLDTINRELITVQATHTDDLSIEYYIDEASMIADPSLDAVKDTAFALNRQTGVLTLTMQPTASMHGMFEFRVVAIDTDGGSDTADVRIYLVSSSNRVTFIFVNTLEKIEESVDFIAATFSAGFQMTCNIDQVVPASDAQGVALEDETEVRAHFIRDNTPVLADEIEQLRSDTILLNEIQNVLRTDLLLLSDFYTEASPIVGTDQQSITIYVLAALTGLLAFMCLVLLLTFVIRTRALNRRLEALSMTKYGSVDSGLNRVGIAAPGTNKHAVEGSNPIWNEVIKAPDFDTISDASDDSDLIGIEDLPQFRNDYFPPGDTSSLQDIMDVDARNNAIPNHSNNFGFKATPFSPDFANRQFR